MPHFTRVLDKDSGRAVMKETPFPDHRVTQLAVAEPAGPSLSAGTSNKGVTCDVCGKTFCKEGPMAHHFNRKHTDLKRNKNTWRKYVRKDEPNSQ